MSEPAPQSASQPETIINRLHGRIIGLTFRRQLLLSFVLGCLSSLAFVPLSFIPLLIPAIMGLLWMVHAANTKKRPFFIGWVFGLGHFLVGLYWIGNAFLVDADRHALLAVPGVVGLAAVVGLYIGLVCWCYHWFSMAVFADKALRIRNILVFAALWTIFEWIRAVAFTGFPWNLMGSIWVVSDPVLQTASVVGVYGLSFISIFVVALPAILVGNNRGLSKTVPTLVIMVGVIGALWVAGWSRLPERTNQHVENEHVENVVLRLVQPNIPQNLKWKRDLRPAHLAKLIKLSQLPAGELGAPTHLIWPETAVPFSMPTTPDRMALLQKAIPAKGVLITGSLRRSITDDANSPSGKRQAVFNALIVMKADGTLSQGYDKFHLVPFGEYVPLQGILPLEKLTAGAVGFTAGDSNVALPIAGVPLVSPLICYEVIFSGQVVPDAEDNNRPGWMLNITNDAWYGKSAGPYQHFATARLRAVEEGLPLVRVANTGISGSIDGYGRIRQSLQLEQTGIIDVPLPKALSVPLYGRYGPRIPIFISASILLCFSVLSVVSRRRRMD